VDDFLVPLAVLNLGLTFPGMSQDTLPRLSLPCCFSVQVPDTSPMEVARVMWRKESGRPLTTRRLGAAMMWLALMMTTPATISGEQGLPS